MTFKKIITNQATVRDRPAGKELAKLKKDDLVFVRGGTGLWQEVEYKGHSAVVAKRCLSHEISPAPRLEALESPLAIPPEASAADIRVVGTNLLGPGGIPFGKLFRLGLYNYGRTSLDKFFENSPNAFPGLSASVQRVMRAVSVNEGKLEAINTWDNAILSCSVYQWTVSADAGAGELPHALNVLKTMSAAAFDRYFGIYKLGVSVLPANPNSVGRGFFTFNGAKLNTAASKAPLRTHLWAYRFWRAAHDPDVRRAYVAVAIERIDVFYRQAIGALGGRPMSHYVTSEAGIAQILDQHVNRPGHVPTTLVSAIKQFIAAGGKKDPAQWNDADEANVIKRYLNLRAATSMTNSDQRAQAINDSVKAGRLSVKRGSYIA